jgi:uncharacterized protein YndB with AHSA1/START domain
MERLTVNVKMGILKNTQEVFEAIVDPDKLAKFFVTKSNGRIEEGKSLTWTWEEYKTEKLIRVEKVESNKMISFFWNGSGTDCLVVINLEAKKENTNAIITESSWPPDFKGAKQCMGQVEGWTHFLCCLKAYLEYGINLRVGGVMKE